MSTVVQLQWYGDTLVKFQMQCCHFSNGIATLLHDNIGP